jgi:hypothetical protein
MPHWRPHPQTSVGAAADNAVGTAPTVFLITMVIISNQRLLSIAAHCSDVGARAQVI